MAKEQMARVKLMGLWWNRTRDGQEYLRGRLGAATVWIFPNNYKDSDESREPDMIAYVSPGPKKNRDGDEDQRGGRGRGGYGNRGGYNDAPPPSDNDAPPPGDDDIPF